MPDTSNIICLDGPMGTELEARGVNTALPRWSATALLDAPQVVAEVHRAYATAGAQVHTTNTFRARPRTLGAEWRKAATLAVQIARNSVPAHHRIAGSIAPLEDCYRPDLSPTNSRPEHRELAQLLAGEGCDLLLVETFANTHEAWTAIEEGANTGLPVWASFTAGPDADLMTPEALHAAALGAVERGASAVLINCVPSQSVEAFLLALADVGASRFGAYANAGSADHSIGWTSDHSFGAEKYQQWAASWIRAGASIIGGCCGTGPSHIDAIARLAMPDSR